MRHGKPEKNILLRDVLYTIEKQGKAAYTRPWFMGDAAELKSKGYDVVLSTNPVIGDLSDLKAEGLARVLNNIWCMGAEPKAVTISVLLP
ncbi:MAG: hypothetical protein IJL97_01610, partial [Lachnospiraceae bacterium]|nr:hypothetical protein [Lachnospiraceae bacterium]